jgi:hypothetical protein
VAHLIDVAALERAYHRQRKDAAVGVDGVTKQVYGRDLDVNLRDLHGRLKAMRYRHQPIRRVHIPGATAPDQRRAVTRPAAVYDWCRCHRRLSIPAQHAALTRRIRGHFNYFGVNGNQRSLGRLYHHARRAWFKWLCRTSVRFRKVRTVPGRSQKKRLNWERFVDLLRDFPIPRPRVYVQIWGS